MAARHDHHHHATVAEPTLSLLRLSAAQRLVGVAAVLLPLWALVAAVIA